MKKEGRNGMVGGLALIILGLVALAGQFIDANWMGMLVLPVLGLIFLAWGILTGQSGLLIPGGILSGLGLGTLLVTGPFSGSSGEVTGGIFMLSFALGWVLIPVFSTIFTRDERHVWAFIPAAIMAFIGSALLFGGAAMSALETAGRFWPIVLILAGLFLLGKQLRNT